LRLTSTTGVLPPQEATRKSSRCGFFAPHATQLRSTRVLPRVSLTL
jgi:hypothetical protein